MQEKRVHPRAPIDVAVSCESADRPPIAGLAKDISVGGMFIQADQTPPFGTNVTVVLRIPGMGSESRLPAVVRWNKPHGFGVQFGLLGARETHAIGKLMRP